MNTSDLPNDQYDENQIRNDNINLDFNASLGQDKNSQIYGQDYLDNQNSAKGGNQANSIQSQPEVKQKVAANALDIRAAGHPGICITHASFKLAALLCFFLISKDHTVINFVLTIIFSAFDFWLVKNITGRKLVLLRWQSEINENGDEKWVYESMDPSVTPNQIDQTFFWFVQFSNCVIWLVISIIEFITLSFFWFVLTFVCFLLNSTNFVGYYKCRGEHQKKIKGYMATVGMKVIANNL